MGADLVMLVAVFVSVSLIAGSLASSTLRRYAPERKRLRALARTHDAAAGPGAVGLTDQPSALAERICRVLPRSAERMSEMRKRLVSAGYRSQTAPVIFAASQIVAAAAVGVIALAVSRQVA